MTTPFLNKRVFITDDFRKENEERRFNEQNYKVLIETLGKGKISRNAFDADIILVAAGTDLSKYGVSEEDSGSKKKKKASEKKDQTQKMFLTWAEFFELIQPTTRQKM